MKNVWHVFRKEFSSYFLSPVAYVVLTVFLVIVGFMFYSNVVWYYQASFSMFQNPYINQSLNLTDDFIRPLFANISVILMFLIPALTMRLFAEENRSGTMELMMSYPVRETEIIIGKYFAAMAFFVVLLFMTIMYPVFLSIVSEPELGPLISAYAGCLFIGATFIAIGIFTSTTTDNQIIAALSAFGLNLVFWIIGWIRPSGTDKLSSILQHISITEHYDQLTKGIINSKDIIYFLSICILFLFLANRVILSKKWRG